MSARRERRLSFTKQFNTDYGLILTMTNKNFLFKLKNMLNITASPVKMGDLGYSLTFVNHLAYYFQFSNIITKDFLIEFNKFRR